MHLPVIMGIIVLYGYGAYYIISAYIQVFKRLFFHYDALSTALDTKK